MLEKSCSTSHGHPVSGARSAAMISISREMSLEGFMQVLLLAAETGGWLLADM